MLRSASLILLVGIATASADFECPEVEGIFPDPDDCRSFYQGSIYALDDVLCKKSFEIFPIDLLAQYIQHL